MCEGWVIHLILFVGFKEEEEASHQNFTNKCVQFTEFQLQLI